MTSSKYYSYLGVVLLSQMSLGFNLSYLDHVASGFDLHILQELVQGSLSTILIIISVGKNDL